MEQDDKLSDSAVSREKKVGEYREVIRVLKERLAYNTREAKQAFEQLNSTAESTAEQLN